MGMKNIVIRSDFHGFARIPEEYGPAKNWHLHEWAQPGYHVAVAYIGQKRLLSVHVHGCGDEQPLVV